MKIQVSFLVVAACLAFTVSSAQGQLRQPTTINQSSFNLTYYLQDDDGQAVPSPSDVEIPDDVVPAPPGSEEEPMPEEPMVHEDVVIGEEDYSDFADEELDLDECEEEEGPIRLFGNCHGLDIGGWVNGGVYANGDGVTSATGNSPVGFVNHSDGAMLNQLWLYAEKALPDADECGCCCNGWGFRMDYVFGTDGPDTQAFGDIGWDNKWDSGRDYGSAIPQLYVEYGNSDLSVKVGHFFTIIGYEVVTAPDNFFYSHAYTMLYGEPFTHTGALVTKRLSDQVSVSGGWTAGWDSGFNNSNDASTFLGSASWTSCDETLSVTYAVTAGDYGNGDVANQGRIYMHSVVAAYQINECMEYVFQTDYFDNTDRGANPDATAGGINQYLFYTLSDCCRLGLRAEWFNDDEGARVAVVDNNYAGGDFYAITGGLNYSPNANVMIRPEVRYDWFRGGGNALPFADATKREQLYYGADVIVQF